MTNPIVLCPCGAPTEVWTGQPLPVLVCTREGCTLPAQPLPAAWEVRAQGASELPGMENDGE